MRKIENYTLPEHTNTLYREEAISSIGLTRDIADKINELINAYNELSETDLQWKQTQEGIIRKGVLYMKDNLLNSLNGILAIYRDSGFIDDRLQYHTRTLASRLDNALSGVTQDGEVIDGRVGEDGTTYKNIGEAIRSQIAQIIDQSYLYNGIDYNTESGVISLNVDKNNNIMLSIFKNKAPAILTLKAETATATYDNNNTRAQIVSLNVVDGSAKLKCTPINTYKVDKDDIILFMIYYQKVIPLSLIPQCIQVDGLPLMDNPTNKKKYTGSMVGLSGQLTINQEALTMTLEEGMYIFPWDRVSAVNITKQEVNYEITGVLKYLVLDINNYIMTIKERDYIFKDTDFCLGAIYMGKFYPIEFAEESIKYTASDREVIIPEKTRLTMNDFFADLSNRTHKTKIVLGGDSITHGVGGTGFAQDGSEIITVGSNTYKHNNNGYCWANLFKDYIEENYNAEVINNGCTGTYSTWWDDCKASLIPADTDIFILTIGTNDRNNSPLTGSTKDAVLTDYYNALTSIVKYCHSKGIQIVLCSPIPASASNEEESTKLAHMYEINAVIQRVASENNMDYANLYNEIFFYIFHKGLSINDLLPDGLHPNDQMYKLMFEHYLKCFNLGPSYKDLT